LNGEAQAAIARLVLCEFETVDRREKSGAKPEQLRCCNWIRFLTSQSIATAIGEGGKKVSPKKPSDRKPGARIFDRSASFASVTLDPDFRACAFAASGF
jgi:hypothetical protein